MRQLIPALLALLVTSCSATGPTPSAAPNASAMGTASGPDRAAVVLGPGDRQPRVILAPAPSYPPELQKAGARGEVLVEFIVGLDGRVYEPRIVSSPDPNLSLLMLEAIQAWRFEPGERAGKAVNTRMRVPVTFNAPNPR